MFKTKQQIALWIFIILIFGCSTEEPADIRTMPVSFAEHDFSLDDIAEDLIFLPLNFGETLISQVMEIKWHEPYLYVCTAEGKGVGRLSLFNLDGKLIKTMDKTGRGPGEYLSIQQYFIDKNGSIYINTWYKIVVFDKNLNHLRDIKWPKELNFAKMHLHNNHIYLFQKSVGVLPKYDWIVLDTVGNYVSSKAFISYHTVAYPPLFALLIFQNSDKLYRYRSISDTIFDVNIQDYKPEYIIDRKFEDGYRMYTKEEITRKVRLDFLMQDLHYEKIRYIEAIHGIGSYWVITYRTHLTRNVKYETALFCCLDNKMILVNRFEYKMGEPIYWGIPNDWVGFGAIKPESVIKIGDDLYIVSVMDVMKLKNMVNSNGFKDGVPKRPDKKREIQALADSLDENSDPVLLLLKLK